jgi:RNA polymerase sigma factor for flagellar operon FliA
MEMTLEELQNWQARFQASRVKSLDEVYTDHSLLFQDVTPSPEEATHQSQLRAMLRTAISKLPEREALVLQLYYVE